MKPQRQGQAPLIAALALLFCCFALAAQAAPSFPKLTGRVVDDANVLSPQTEASLTSELADLEAKTTRQVVVVTLPSLQGYEISDYGYQLGRFWQIGQKGENNGVIFIVVPSEHKVRIEVGYGLEPVLTDALSSVILQQAVLPKFRSGDIEGGVVQGTNAIVGQLSQPDDLAKAKVAQAEQAVARPHPQKFNPFGLIPLLIIFFVVVSILRRGGGGGAGWLLPFILMGGGRGGGDGWGGGGGGGGGFSGGGGSFGGGGSSGSW